MTRDTPRDTQPGLTPWGPHNQGKTPMILTTTDQIEGPRITAYQGIAVGEAIKGANILRNMFVGITDNVGGRSGACESKLQGARETALAESQGRAVAQGANAVVGIDLDYEVVGQSMLMVSASGMAVVIE
jgi:uncharacterized protein YbjQ (UPF0145 family)